MSEPITERRRRVVLITGAGSGLGLLAAVELARRGERVFASMRDLDKGELLREQARATGAEVELVALDVTSTDSVAAAIEHVVQAAGRLDVVVNNAAVATVGALESSTEHDVTSIFDTNVIGAIRVIRAALPVMRRQGTGRIVNVSSGTAHARAGVRLMSLYAASKAALHTLTLDLNKELAPLGIRAVLVEGGVGGASRMNEALAARVAAFGAADSPYAVAERIAAGQIRGMMHALSDGSAAARMIVEACTVADPALRFPPEAQRGLDSLRRLNDQDFLKLCALEDTVRVLDRNGLSQSPWRVTG
jgi:NAD(P)-dependent dehydrogenase (short-subunit alcohol dehydrogenase family)